MKRHNSQFLCKDCGKDATAVKDGDLMKVHVTLSKRDAKTCGVAGEWVWAREVRAGRARINNIPFFATRINLDDEVSFDETTHEVRRVTKRSMHGLVQIFLDEGVEAKLALQPLQTLGCQLEGALPRYFVATIPPGAGDAVRQALNSSPGIAGYDVVREPAESSSSGV